MPTAEKEKTIEQAKGWFEKSVGLVFTDYRGLSVKEMQQLRSLLRVKGGELHVVKNTLFRRAAGAVIESFPSELHNGPTAIAFVFENETDCAKVLWDFSVSHKAFEVKGGYFGGSVFDNRGVERLSKLPSREVLIAQVIGAIAAPLTGLVGVVEALYAQPIRTVYAAADKLGAAPDDTTAEAPAPAEPDASPPGAVEAEVAGAPERAASTASPSESDEAAASTASADSAETETSQERTETPVSAAPEPADESDESSPSNESNEPQE
jgi:large subunit ribosomal protein L10